MSQSEVGKAEAAEERSEETRSFVRAVKAATRLKYTPEEKIRIVLEGFRREVTVNDLCRREGIKPHSYYSWTKEFMEAGKERLAGTQKWLRKSEQGDKWNRCLIEGMIVLSETGARDEQTTPP